MRGSDLPGETDQAAGLRQGETGPPPPASASPTGCVAQEPALIPTSVVSPYFTKSADEPDVRVHLNPPAG